jgi:hypothetical protein
MAVRSAVPLKTLRRSLLLRLQGKRFAVVVQDVDAMYVEATWVDEYGDAYRLMLRHSVKHEVFPGSVRQRDHDGTNVGGDARQEGARSGLGGTPVRVDAPGRWDGIAASTAPYGGAVGQLEVYDSEDAPGLRVGRYAELP